MSPAASSDPPATVASAVTAVLRLVMDGASLRACLDSLCGHLEATCGVDVAATFVLDDGRLRLSGHGHLPEPLASMSEAQADASQTAVGRAWHLTRPVVIHDLAEADQHDRHANQLAIEAGLRGVLTVPVTGVEHRALGVLALGTLQPRTWGESTIDLVGAFADLAALVLERRQARTRAEQARDRMTRLSHRLAAVLDAVPTPTFELDQDGRVTRWNRAAAIVAGWRGDAVIGRPLTSMGPGWSPMAPRVDDARRGIASTGQVEVGRRDGTALVLEVRLNPLIDDAGITSVIGTLTDLTDRLAMEAGIRRSQRMEALGQFAGGIAHDFGNILSAIAGFADLLEFELPDDATHARTDVAQIRQVAERGRSLTNRLLDFAHSHPTAPSPVDVAAGVRALVRVLAGSLPDGCDLVLDVEEAPAVLLGRGQLDQLLMNLVGNAGDAMPDGGTVTVRVRPNDQSVLIEVADEGRGIPAPLLDRVFEPFFTTKGAHGGTGLGLANVYSIVRGAGGHVDATSLVDRGTRFRIELPAAPSDTDTVVDAAGTAPRLLVVEPEDVSRQILHTSLASAGYRVMAVGQPEEVNLAEVATTDPVQLVICAATAGTPADPALASLLMRMRRLQPTLALVELGEHGDSSRDPGVTTITRPFLAGEVVATVERALARVTPSPDLGQPAGS